MPARSVSEFIAYAKANAGKINMAGGGAGSPDHMAGELFKIETGVKIAYVPYRGLAPALGDLMESFFGAAFGRRRGLDATSA